jgi:hypothetical protein
MASAFDLKKSVRALAQSRLGVTLRNLSGIRQLPFRWVPHSHPVSDAFFWRSEGKWLTMFQLMNLPSILEPDIAAEEQVIVIVTGANGEELGRHSFVLRPFEVVPILLNDLSGGKVPFGFFTVYHVPTTASSRPRQSISSISDNGYVGFRRQDDGDLWSYAHGKDYTFAFDPTRAQQYPLRRLAGGDACYRPQTRFDDALASELVFVNPLASPTPMRVDVLDVAGRAVRSIERNLQPHEVWMMNLDNKERPAVCLSIYSQMDLMRPLIFKYYSTHFDVFHG